MRFLQNGFFEAIAACRGINARPANDDEAIKALAAAGQALKSTLVTRHSATLVCWLARGC